MTVTVSPARPLRGAISAPASKSDAHRAIIAAALSERATKIELSELCADTRATLDCLTAMGASFSHTDGVLTVNPIGKTASAPLLDASESGSALRFLLPVAAALGLDARVTGRGRLPERPIAPLLSELSAHGAVFDSDRLPLSMTGRLTGGDFTLPGNLSSQFISGLLFALPLTGDACRVTVTGKLESEKYVEMTRAVLSRYGVHWEKRENTYLLAAGAAYRSPLTYTVEGDYSGAAFYLVAGALGGDTEISILGKDSLQADRAVLDALALAGAEITENEGRIRVRAQKLRPFSFDVSACPDIFPILAILAAAAEGESHLFGAARLRNKESDRIAATASLLRALGCTVTEHPDSLSIFGNGRLSGGTVLGVNDHRIVMSAAVAAILADAPVVITDAEAINKSYPAFFADYQTLGGNVDGIELR